MNAMHKLFLASKSSLSLLVIHIKSRIFSRGCTPPTPQVEKVDENGFRKYCHPVEHLSFCSVFVRFFNQPTVIHSTGFAVHAVPLSREANSCVGLILTSLSGRCLVLRQTVVTVWYFCHLFVKNQR